MAQLEARVERLEERADVTDIKLAEGATQFAVLGTKLEHLTDKVGALVAVLAWVGGAIGLGVLTAAGTALAWVMTRMGGA